MTPSGWALALLTDDLDAVPFDERLAEAHAIVWAAESRSLAATLPHRTALRHLQRRLAADRAARDTLRDEVARLRTEVGHLRHGTTR